MKFHTKIVLVIIIIALTIGILVSLLVTSIVHEMFEKELQTKGLMVSELISARVIDNVVDKQVLPTTETLKQVVNDTEDVKYIYIVGFDGKVFAHSFGEGFPCDFIHKNHYIINKNNSENNVLLDGKEILEVNRPLINGMEASVFVGLDEDKVHNNVKSLNWHINYITIGIIIFAVILGIVISKRITAPIEQLAVSMEVYGKGEIIDTVIVKYSSLEVRRLSTAFNEMINERTKIENELEHYKNNLEVQVNERTTELKETNEMLKSEITERELIENKLAASEKFTRTVLDSIPLEICVIDVNRLTIISANNTFLKEAGLTRQEVIGKKSNEITDYLISQCVLPNFINDMKINGTPLTIEQIHFDNGGEKSFVELTCGPIKDDEGNIFQIVYIARNINKRKMNEALLKDAHEKLSIQIQSLVQQRQEIAMLGEFGEMLQTALNEREIGQILSDFASRLIAGSNGALYLRVGESALFEMAGSWGSQTTMVKSFSISDCWALRQGRAYMAHNPENGIICDHVAADAATEQRQLQYYICVPLISQVKLHGVLHINYGIACKSDDIDQEDISSCMRIASVIADRLSITLANLHLREKLREQSIHDPLTNLFNRRYMDESLALDIHRVRRDNKFLGIIMMDIDHFKAYNDNYGHETGDQALKAIAAFLQRNIRAGDVACRFGGEEFVLILHDVSLEGTVQYAETLRESAHRIKIHFGDKILPSITLSIGVAIFPMHGDSAETIMKAADDALYHAKQGGRDRVVVAHSRIE